MCAFGNPTRVPVIGSTNCSIEPYVVAMSAVGSPMIVANL